MASIQLTSIDDPRMTPPIREKWQDEALCAKKDPEIFFPGVGGSTLEAKRICADCDVKLRCLEYALRTEASHYRSGVFGGLSGVQRNNLIKLMENNPSLTLEEAYDVITAKRVRKVVRRNKAA